MSLLKWRELLLAKLPRPLSRSVSSNLVSARLEHKLGVCHMLS